MSAPTRPPTSRCRRLCRPIARSWPVRLSAWEAVIKNDSPRTLTGSQGDPPRRRQTDRDRAAGDRAARRRLACRLTVPFPGSGPHELSLKLPGRRAARRQRALGRRAGQRLAADPPGGRRAVVGAVRLRGRLSGRALLDRHRRGGGLARRGGPGSRFPLPATGSRRRARPGQCRRPDARAGRAPGPPGQGRDGPLDLHRRPSSTSASTTTCSTAPTTGSCRCR